MKTEEIYIKLTKEKAKHILHALKRTNSKNSDGDLNGILDTVDELEKELFNKIHSNNIKHDEEILMNKPCLTIKEVCLEVGKCNQTTYIDLNKLTTNLKKIVNEKLI